MPSIAEVGQGSDLIRQAARLMTDTASAERIVKGAQVNEAPKIIGEAFRVVHAKLEELDLLPDEDFYLTIPVAHSTLALINAHRRRIACWLLPCSSISSYDYLMLKETSAGMPGFSFPLASLSLSLMAKTVV